MLFMRYKKDGGPKSHVHGLFFIEMKRLFSVVLMRFSNGTRDAYHSHAFNAVSWLLYGRLEETLVGGGVRVYTPSWRPIWTPRECFHKVNSVGPSWAITFRGPWTSTWHEKTEAGNLVTLTNGRKVVS